MAGRTQTGASALEFLPSRITMASLRQAARACHGCPLYKNATQTVFGEHPSAVLRQRTSRDRHREMAGFVADLEIVAGLLRG